MKKILKKAISMLLVSVLLASAFCVSVSATEEVPIEKQRLGKLIELHEREVHWVGAQGVYGDYSGIAYKRAVEVYENEASEIYDYENESRMFLDAKRYSNYVLVKYARYTCEFAKKEQNYNNWYSDDDWNNFQTRLKELESALDSLPSGAVYSMIVTEKYHALLRAYNEMVSRHKLRGDVNGDGTVNVEDATLLQKYLCGMEQLTGEQKMLANAEEYENPSVNEVTTIQKYLSGIIEEMPNNNVFITDENFPYFDMDLLNARVLNFNICPRSCKEMYIRGFENNYMEVSYTVLQYYAWCEKVGIEP